MNQTAEDSLPSLHSSLKLKLLSAVDKPYPHCCGTQVHPFILVPHREVLTLCLSAALKHFFGKSTGQGGTEYCPGAEGGRETRKDVYVLAEGSFKSLFLGLYARRTHTIMNTHTQIHE